MAEKNKLLTYRILQILKEHSDESHRLQQKQIQQYLLDEYHMEVERGSVRRSVHELVEADNIPVEAEEEHRGAKRESRDGEIYQPTAYKGIWYAHEFEPSELRLMADGIAFSKYMKPSQKKALIEKILRMGGEYFDHSMSYVQYVSPDRPKNDQLFYILMIIDEAIREGKKIKLEYGYMGPDFTMIPAFKRKNGKPYMQLINPYRIVARDGYYYLICNKENYQDYTFYRIDRIMQIEITKEPVKSVREIDGLIEGMDLQTLETGNIMMAFGPSGRITFGVPKKLVRDVIDAFGNDVTFSQEDHGYYNCAVVSNYYSFEKWALQHIPDVVVLSPDEVVSNIRRAIRQAMRIYS